MRHAVLAVALLIAAACEAPAPAPAPSAKAPPRPVEPPVTLDPPPQRLAIPMRLLNLRLTDAASAGRLVRPDAPEGVPLQAVGLNLCQNGFVLQAFFRRGVESLAATPPFPLPVLREGPYVHRDPLVPGQRIETDFQEASMTRLRGTFRLVEEATSEKLLDLTIDTVPVGVATGPGLGPQGCFTTGHWTIEQDGTSFEGPTSAVSDDGTLTWVGIRLDSRHTIDFWVTIAPQHRQPQHMLRGDLERIGAEPRKFPFRVVFRARDDAGETTEIPAESGKLTAAFTRANPEGPIRIELVNLRVPEWKGPFTGQTLDRVRAETLIVTDLEGARVPVPGTK